MNYNGPVGNLNQLLEEEEVEVLVVKESAKEPAKMETDEASLDPAPSSTTETNISMQDAKGSVELLVETPKKKVKKTSVPVSELVYGGMATIDLQKSMEMEVEIALQDRVIAKLEELQKFLFKHKSCPIITKSMPVKPTTPETPSLVKPTTPETPSPMKPTTPETPSATPSQGGESQCQGAENPNSSPNQNSVATETTGSGNEVPSTATEPMERD
ncbi:Hypothetical predicted protein [Olea europaea subsp. europaea]|uniref:Uncharacterized protein n=1 Tax=Olea europaea subsp. europaea TaxID=158383 RepID=A0A8S0SRZ0_OLEEU|nr:Hypothetical predicted protein [Olea europaea subsp. europaea]